MKPVTFIPPVVALVIAGSWLGVQQHSISVLESESTLLRKHIADARAASVSPASAKPDKPPGAKAKDKEPLDWKKIAAEAEETRGANGMGDMRTMIHLQQRLLSMSKEELVAALDEIATLDLSSAARGMLEQMLIGPLIEKDPELALTRFADRIRDQRNGVAWQLSNALGKWAAKDPEKARAWFDKQIEAGIFDSKSLDNRNQTRNQFEGSLISSLLGTNPDDAGRRLGALPEEQRREVLTNYAFQQLKDQDQQAFAKLVRSQLPENAQASTIANQTSRMVMQGGYEKVTEYLDRINASATERSASVEQAAESKFRNLARQKTLAREDVDAMRTWADSQAPGTADRATGSALGNAMGGNRLKFEDAAALAVQYHDSSGNDDVLTAFLGNYNARNNKDQARVLAEKISDLTRREEILNNLK